MTNQIQNYILIIKKCKINNLLINHNYNRNKINKYNNKIIILNNNFKK